MGGGGGGGRHCDVIQYSLLRSIGQVHCKGNSPKDISNELHGNAEVFTWPKDTFCFGV